MTGNLSSSSLPSKLMLLNVSHNDFSGPLPSNLPCNLSVLDMSDNSFSSALPGNWSTLQKMAVVRLDNNKFAGTLPAAWSAWGSNTRNSLQLSVTNTSLHGRMPQQWIQQFCLAILRSSETRVLFEPVPVEPNPASNLRDIYIPGSYASITSTAYQYQCESRP